MRIPRLSTTQWIMIAAIIPSILSIVLMLVLPNTNTQQKINDSPNSINTIGQLGGTNIINTDEHLRKQMEYLDVSKLNIYGLGYDQASTSIIIVSSPLSVFLAPFLSPQGNNPPTHQCTRDAMMAYQEVIREVQKFPFTYFYLGSCERELEISKGKSAIDSAKEILEITTKIPGHHRNHDEVLRLINENYSK